MTDQADDDRRAAMLLMAARLAELEPLARNRWLAFTDDELAGIERTLLRVPGRAVPPAAERLLGEIRLEVTRRERELTR